MHALLFAAIALHAIADAPAMQSATLPAAQTSVSACKAVDTDKNLSAIVGDIFKKKPIDLLKAGKLPKAFFDSISGADFYICNDRLWDAMTLPGQPPRLVFDRSLLTLLYMESQSLVIGQYIKNDYGAVKDPLALHGALMKYVAAQNLDSALPLISFQSLVDSVVGKPVDLDKYMSNKTANDQMQKLWLNSLYFLIFHEFCHIDADRRAFGAQRRDQASADEANQSEVEADECAVNTINRDEGQFGQSPISFLSVFMVASTQGVLENVLRQSDAKLGHPASSVRLRKAHALVLSFIAASPKETRYRDTLDGVLAHFLAVLPK